MDQEVLTGLNEDWAVVQSLLPPGWQDKARQTRALFIPKEFKDAATLLRVMLIHLSEGCSLRETAARASAAGLVHVSDVALLKRLRKCGPWFHWMSQQLCARLTAGSLPQWPGRRIRLVDASVVCEPGATGSTWRLHYALDLSTLCCDQVTLSDASVGESFKHYDVKAGDILMADRGLAHRGGVAHVLQAGADVIVRMSLTHLPLQRQDGQALNLSPWLRKLRVGQAAEQAAWMRCEQGLIPVRICAIKKSAAQTRKAQDKVHQEASKDKRLATARTVHAAGYVIVLSTLGQHEASAQQVLQLYRCRWQVELAFKRLKSLLQLGHLKKTDHSGSLAWLQGKLLVATLIETLIAAGDHFSPWGYELCASDTQALSLA